MGDLLRLLLTVVILLFLSGCAEQIPKSPYIKDGKEYGIVQGVFRQSWWNHYERGVSFLNGEYFQEAATDFQEAIRQRAKDQRMARTYGMHFVDYFPHRELGIAYYEMRNLEAARKELELSLAYYPTAKAGFYLNRVRKAFIEQQTKVPHSPDILFDHRTEEIRTREDPVVLSGLVEDEHYVVSISCAGLPLFVEAAQKTMPFHKELQLPQGKHVVVVEARNLLGQMSHRSTIIHVDREGPLITLSAMKPEESVDALPGKKVSISGSVYDESDVRELLINGRSVPIRKGTEVLFNEETSVTDGNLELIARDALGNQTSAVIPVRQVLSQRRWPLLASAAGRLTGLFGRKDDQPPVIQMKGWTEQQTVFLEKVYVEGQVSDDTKIAGLFVNQKSVLRREGRTILFSHLADLKEGENTILVEARDDANNTTAFKITIIRRIPKALQMRERMSLTIVPFEQKGIVSESSLSLHDSLISSLVNQNRFQVVDRDQLDKILQEQKISRTRLVDRDTALMLGKLVAARSVIVGSIIESRKGIEIVARMIDTETSMIIETEDVYDEAKDLMSLKKLSEGLAIKFHQKFPLLDGNVIQQKGNVIFTDLGTGKVKLHRRLIIFREELIKHPITGKVLGADNIIIGRARITQILSDLSKAEISSNQKMLIKTMDRVITE